MHMLRLLLAALRRIRRWIHEHKIRRQIADEQRAISRRFLEKLHLARRRRISGDVDAHQLRKDDGFRRD